MSTTTMSRSQCLALDSQRARDLMSPNPVSIRGSATVQEATALMTDHGFSAAPVIDEAGRPIGVVSRTDILVHGREYGRRAGLRDDTDWDVFQGRSPREGFSVEVVDPTQVRDIMTPAIFTVTPQTPAAKVVETMLAFHVHQLFVVDADEALIGVISALDVLRHL
jgi:CBS domain-containing protein